MAELDSFLAETLEAWRDVRHGIVAELQNIPAKQLDFRPTPESRSVREVVQHILEVSMMMTGELTRPDTDFKREPWPKLLKKYAGDAYRANTKPELLKLLVNCRCGNSWSGLTVSKGPSCNGFITGSPRRCITGDSSRRMHASWAWSRR
jgi:hypothetical protein